MDVSENSGTPKSSILVGFSIINHPFWGTPIFGNTHMKKLSNLHHQQYNNLPKEYPPPLPGKMSLLHYSTPSKKNTHTSLASGGTTGGGVG